MKMLSVLNEQISVWSIFWQPASLWSASLSTISAALIIKLNDIFLKSPCSDAFILNDISEAICLFSPQAKWMCQCLDAPVSQAALNIAGISSECISMATGSKAWDCVVLCAWGKSSGPDASLSTYCTIISPWADFILGSLQADNAGAHMKKHCSGTERVFVHSEVMTSYVTADSEDSVMNTRARDLRHSCSPMKTWHRMMLFSLSTCKNTFNPHLLQSDYILITQSLFL